MDTDSHGLDEELNSKKSEPRCTLIYTNEFAGAEGWRGEGPMAEALNCCKVESLNRAGGSVKGWANWFAGTVFCNVFTY
jgi:hypothetical protein